MKILQFVYSSVNGHCVFFQFEAIMNEAAVHVLYRYVFICQLLKRGFLNETCLTVIDILCLFDYSGFFLWLLFEIPSGTSSDFIGPQ